MEARCHWQPSHRKVGKSDLANEIDQTYKIQDLRSYLDVNVNLVLFDCQRIVLKFLKLAALNLSIESQ